MAANRNAEFQKRNAGGEKPAGRSKLSSAGRWVSYRPSIRILDCTVRDGGLMNNHAFDPAVVRGIYDACTAAGIDYMEMGYKSSKRLYSKSEFGPWKFCDEDDIRRIVGENKTGLKLSVMADTDRTDYREDILPKKDSVFDMIRVAAYIHQIPAALDMVKDAHDKGYETTINLMAISSVNERELDEALELVAGSEVDVIYLVDSFGALYCEQIQYLMRKYMHYARQSGKEVGIHTHNNMQLAYANTIEAIIMGANYLDASMAGLGRGAGNCPLELLVGFLHNPKFKLRPILQCIQEHVEPLRATFSWGYDIPYMMTGLLNQHPRSAIACIEEGRGKDIVRFFDSLIERE